MTIYDFEKYYKQMADHVVEKLKILNSGSLVKKKLYSKVTQIAHQSQEDLRRGRNLPFLPPLFLFVARRSLKQIQKFDGALRSVTKAICSKTHRHFLQFLDADGHEDRLWEAGIFETFVKSTYLQENSKITKLDHPLQNGRNVDVCLNEASGKKVFLECSVLTASDPARQTWSTYWEEGGSFEDVLVTTGNPAHLSYRFYAKIYDKLAYEFDPMRSQLEDDHPNLLLISLSVQGERATADDPFIKVAIQELFKDTYSTDDSFFKWFEFTKSRVVDEDKDKIFDQCALLNAKKKISAIILFEGYSFKNCYVNHNAMPNCKIDEGNVSSIINGLKRPPLWES